MDSVSQFNKNMAVLEIFCKKAGLIQPGSQKK